jgi:hypothetical protein
MSFVQKKSSNRLRLRLCSFAWERVRACTLNRAPRLMDMDSLARLQTMMRRPSLGTQIAHVTLISRSSFARPAEKMNAR